jgi:hypothetical protein
VMLCCPHWESKGLDPGHSVHGVQIETIGSKDEIGDGDCFWQNMAGDDESRRKFHISGSHLRGARPDCWGISGYKVDMRSISA